LATKGLLAISAAVEQLHSAYADRRKERQSSSSEREDNPASVETGSTLQVLPLNRLKPEALPAVCDLRSLSRTDAVQNSEESERSAPLEGFAHEDHRPNVPVVL
jgi:hypothetical protein